MLEHFPGYLQWCLDQTMPCFGLSPLLCSLSRPWAVCCTSCVTSPCLSGRVRWRSAMATSPFQIILGTRKTCTASSVSVSESGTVGFRRTEKTAEVFCSYIPRSYRQTVGVSLFLRDSLAHKGG